MNYEMLDKIVGSLGEASNNPMSGEGVAWLNEKYGGKEKDSRSLLQKTQDLGNELWNISYAGSAVRSIGRAANPSAEYDWRKEKLAEWKKNEYQISPEEENAWLNTPARPTPEGVLQGEADRKREEEAFIKSQGGYFNTIVKSIAEDPTGFAINLAKGIIADPELLGLPSIYKSGAAAVLKQLPNAIRTAELAGGAAEVAVGAGIIAGGEAIQSEEQTGSMDPARVKQGAMLGAGMGGVAAVAQGFMRAVGRAGKLAETKTGVDSKEVQARIFDYATSHPGTTYQEAIEIVLKDYDVDPSAVIDDINNVANKVKDTLDPEGKMGPLTKRETLQARAQEDVFLAGKREPPMGATEEPPKPSSPTTYPSGRLPSERRLAAAQGGESMAPRPVNYGEGYGLIESTKPDIVAATEAAAHAREQFQPLVESIARKEQEVLAIKPKERDIIDELFEYPAYRPNRGAITAPILTLDEFASTTLGKNKNGKPLSAPALASRYMKFHKEMQGANRDPTQTVTIEELRQIMAENSSEMRDFFLKQSRKEGTRKQVPAKFRSQQGSATQDLMTYVGAAGLMALIGYSKDNDVGDAVGYALAAGASLAGGGKLLRMIGKRHPVTSHMIEAKSGVKLDDLMNKFQGEGAVYERKVLQIVDVMKRLSGDDGSLTRGLSKANREARQLRKDITLALEDRTGQKFKQLPPHGQELYKYAEELYAKVGKEAESKGILDGTIDYYVNHVWQHSSRSTEELLNTLFGSGSRKTAMDTIHRQTRIIPTYQLGIDKGLKPRTTDIADLMSIYLKSIDQADRSKQFMEALKNTAHPLDPSNKLMMRSQKAPRTYMSVNHPKFDGWKVAPDIYHPVRAMFGSSEFNVLTRGLMGLNFFLKRSLVSLSGFHAKALLMSNLMAGGIWRGLRHPITGTADIINMFKGKSPALQMLRGTLDEKTVGSIDEGLRNGLIIQMVDDVGNDTFYEALTDLSSFLDGAYERAGAKAGVVGKVAASPAKVAGYAVKGVKGLNRLTDAVMWDRIYTSLKVTTYLDRMSYLSQKYGTTIPRSDLSKWAAEFTNDAFGGLNWLRLAQNVENKYGSRLAYSLAGKEGRAAAQALMFAPDWTTSNLRVFYKAFANKNKVQRELYQRYQFNGMLMFGIMGDALNYSLTGHHIWENKDIGTIELGNGRRFAASKQIWEPAHWMLKLQQTAMNKLSTIISTGAEVLMGKEYLAVGGNAPNIEGGGMGYLGHILGKALPIWTQQGIKSGSWGDMFASQAGVPIYGKAASAKTGRSYTRSGSSRGSSQRKYTR